jgi:hypothetical protein
MDKTVVGLIAISAVLGTVILIVIIICVVYSLRYTKIMNSVSIAVDNNLFCTNQEGPCQLKVSDRLIQPLLIDTLFNYEVSRYCADLVARVELLFYHTNGLKALEMPPQLKQETILYFKDTIIGYIASSELSPIVWISFRGTANESEWRQDFDFNQVDLQLSNVDNQTRFELKNGQTLSCHQGFLNVFNEFKVSMVQSVENIGPKQIVISGHSLGASLATLASLELSKSYEVFTYVFGSPRVCDYIPPIINAFWRVNNTTDVITDIPLSVMPNIADKNKPYFYTHGGKSMEFTDNRQSLTNNHLLPVYINAIEKYTLK